MKNLQYNSKMTFPNIATKGKLVRLLIPILLLFLIVPSSCTFLDYNEIDTYSENMIFDDFTRVRSLLTNTYSYLPDYFRPIGDAMRASATDDAVHVLSTSPVLKFNDGSWSAINTVDDVWRSMYRGIRSANFFIENATGLTFDDIKYSSSYEQDMEQYSYYPYEARFLRAFFYFELIKRYHDVPLVTTMLTEEEANNVEKTSFEDIVNFIVRECDLISSELPESFNDVPGAQTGRANRYATLALKARTLLYAASPLNNSSNDLEKWVDAAKAAHEIIDGGDYSLEPNYANIVNNLKSKELIFERRYNNSNSFERANFPVGYEGGNTGTCPTQNLVDAYEMKTTGLAINHPGSNYDSAAPFADRDPRLAATVIYNGSIWKNSPVEIWDGGKNGPPVINATETGYYLKKNVVEKVNLEKGKPQTTAEHNGILFRFGEVLLNYAEAMNEAYGPEVTGDDNLTMTARMAINLIRARADMPDFPSGMTQSDFRTKLRNERRVELAFENHRFWDIRRWKIGNATTTIYGVDLVKDSSDEIIYTKKVVEQRVWDDRMYFYPMPATERYINDNLTQNPGW